MHIEALPTPGLLWSGLIPSEGAEKSQDSSEEKKLDWLTTLNFKSYFRLGFYDKCEIDSKKMETRKRERGKGWLGRPKTGMPGKARSSSVLILGMEAGEAREGYTGIR